MTTSSRTSGSSEPVGASTDADVHVERGYQLYAQARFDLAEDALRLALSADPDDAYAHALLALCLEGQDQYEKAADEARRAVGLDPSEPLGHYALGRAAQALGRYEEAVASSREAIRLDPESPQKRWLLGSLLLDLGEAREALDMAEEGLRLDSEHSSCNNLRALALVHLGRDEEAVESTAAALARNPENPHTHAARGWALIRTSPPAALEHFREALRLDPSNEPARAGLVESLKSRNRIYHAFLRYSLRMDRLSVRARWAVLLGLVFAYQMVQTATRSDPRLTYLAVPVLVLWCVFVLLTWIARPVFNLILRGDRAGRHALTGEAILETNLVGSALLLALLLLAAAVFAGFDSPFPVAALGAGALTIPIAGTFNCASGRPRSAMAAVTGVTAMTGIVALTLALTGRGNEVVSALYFLGVAASSWLSNVLDSKPPGS